MYFMHDLFPTDIERVANRPTWVAKWRGFGGLLSKEIELLSWNCAPSPVVCFRSWRTK